MDKENKRNALRNYGTGGFTGAMHCAPPLKQEEDRLCFSTNLSSS